MASFSLYSALNYHYAPPTATHKPPSPPPQGHQPTIQNQESIQRLRREKQPHEAEKLKLELISQGVFPDKSTSSSSSLMLSYARNDFLSEADVFLGEILNSSWVFDVNVVTSLVLIGWSRRDFDMIRSVLCRVKLRDFKLLRKVFSRVIVCSGRRGEIELMEFMFKQMVCMGMSVDSVSANAYVVYRSACGSLREVEAAYGRLKGSRILIEEEAIRAVAFAYIREGKFYSLGKFVEDVGLGRKNVKNLLWNLLILSYAAKFKMKSMQREFVRMVESSFRPDLTTFNIRAMAFSKMMLFWDLHLSL